MIPRNFFFQIVSILNLAYVRLYTLAVQISET